MPVKSICPICHKKFINKDSFELLILRAFVEEFHPFYAPDVDQMGYYELIEIVKEIVEEF